MAQVEPRVSESVRVVLEKGSFARRKIASMLTISRRKKLELNCKLAENGMLRSRLFVEYIMPTK